MGFVCVVRVNNREYRTDTGYQTEGLARENAAMRAYLICRNFSVNDGKFPAGQGSRGEVVQGRPVAIGTERRSTASSSSSYTSLYSDDSSISSGSRSGGSSPGQAEFPRYAEAGRQWSRGYDHNTVYTTSRRR